MYTQSAIFMHLVFAMYISQQLVLARKRSNSNLLIAKHGQLKVGSMYIAKVLPLIYLIIHSFRISILGMYIVLGTTCDFTKFQFSNIVVSLRVGVCNSYYSM